MVDCGIMDSDSNPYPDVTEEELAKTDYVFLTHSHKDHSGAFMHFVEKGFRGTLVTSAMAFELSDITYDKVVILSGPLKGMESTIQRIDRHKRKAWLNLEMFGRQQLVEVGVEIVKKVACET